MVDDNGLVGWQGFLCPKSGGQPVSWDMCLNECQGRCHPLPLLYALRGNSGPFEPYRFSISDLVGEIQRAYLRRNIPYWTKPLSRLWAIAGSAWHQVVAGARYALEQGTLGQDGTRIEEKYECQTEIDGELITLVGIVDMYTPLDKTLWDYKTTSVYNAKKILKFHRWDESDHRKQLNAYRALWLPETEHMRLTFLMRDWNGGTPYKDGIHSMLEYAEVPKMEDEDILALVVDGAQTLMRLERDGGTPPQCTELYWKAGKPVRCLEYCEYRDHCPQFATMKGAKNGETASTEQPQAVQQVVQKAQ